MKARRYALILFSSMNRCGATEEADNPDEALKTAGNDVTKIEWSNVAEIHNIIDSAMSGMVAMASELRSVDGKKDIGTMFTNAVRKMEENEFCNHLCQQPEYRMTTQKYLILPTVSCEPMDTD